jgi:hypothetical protein
MRPSRLVVPMLVMVLPIAALGCGGKATPTPAAPTATAVIDITPTLTVVSPTVQYRDKEEQPLVDIARGESVDVIPGGNVIVGDAGHAVLEWADFMTGELLGGTDVLVGLSLPSKRQVQLDQATGTARYVLQGAGTPADIQIKARWIDVGIAAGLADVIVTLVPGTEPAVWVTALDGSASISRDTEVVDLAAGQVVAITESGAMARPVDVDRAAIEAWYRTLAEGTAKGDITTVAFRCTVSSATADLLTAPDPAAEPAGDALESGTVVIVVGRDATSSWLQVRPIVSQDEGWVSVDALSCVGPIDQAALIEEAVATPTRAIVPTRIVFVTPTTVLGTVTPTPTPTVGDYTIKFWTSDDSIAYGTCTQLKWETNNIREVYFQGKGVPGNGSSDECPTDDATYTLKVILRDGSEQTRSVSVKVREPEDTATPQPSNTSPPAATTEAPPPTAESPTETPTS